MLKAAITPLHSIGKSIARIGCAAGLNGSVMRKHIRYAHSVRIIIATRGYDLREG